MNEIAIASICSQSTLPDLVAGQSSARTACHNITAEAAESIPTELICILQRTIIAISYDQKCQVCSTQSSSTPSTRELTTEQLVANAALHSDRMQGSGGSLVHSMDGFLDRHLVSRFQLLFDYFIYVLDYELNFRTSTLSTGLWRT